MISKNKPSKGWMGAPHHIERAFRGEKSCASCIYFESDDGSCSIHPIVINEVGYNYYKNCKEFERRQERYNKNKTGKYDNRQIARVMSNAISNNGNLKEVAKSLNISLYKALVLYNDVYGELFPMNQTNINKLRNYGISKNKIAEFYGVNILSIDKIENDNKSSKQDIVKENENIDIVRKVSKGICDLCNNKRKDVNIQYIDENKSRDIEYIF